MKRKNKIFFLVITTFAIGFSINYSLFKPSKFNFLIANRIYGSPANSAFKDENFYKCVVDAYNSENNTNLPYTTNLTDEQLGNIKKLDCSGMNKGENEKITDVNGLNKLSSLTTLNIGFNKIENIDIRNNTELTTLEVRNNKLTSLDVSNNTSLKDLRVNNNQLTKLDVSKNLELYYLYVGFNQLTSLDVSKNTVLYNLNAQGAILESLDVSNNPNLHFLAISGNQLTNLDVSNNPNLEDLTADKNQLTSLDVSKNSKLKELIIYNNQLTNLNINNNPELQNLDIHNNQLTDLNLSSNIALSTLKAENNNLTSLNIDSNINLQNIYLAGNNLKVLNLTNNLNLLVLDLGYWCNNYACSNLSQNNQLQNIDVSHNVLLKELNINNNLLTEIDLSKNNNLENLRLSGNKITNVDISNNLALKILDVSDNYMVKDNIVYRLSNIDVTKNVNLKELNISYNGFSQINLNKNILLEKFYAYENKLNSIDLSFNDKLFLIELAGNELTDIKCNSNICDKMTLYDLSHGEQGKRYYIYKNDFSNIHDSRLLELVNEQGSEKKVYTTQYYYLGKDDKKENYDFNYRIYHSYILTDKYLIDEIDNYIYTGLDNSENFINQNIQLFDDCPSSLLKFTSFIENNKYIIKNAYTYENSKISNTPEQISKQFDLINISSNKYNLTKDYIFDFGEDILSNINVLNGDKVINDNKVQIKKGEDILQEFNYVTATSDKYDLSLDKIKVQDYSVGSLISNINCTNCVVKIKNNDTYKTSGDFTDGDTLVIMYNDELLKEYELSYAVKNVKLNNKNLKLNLDKKNTFKLEATVLPNLAENKNVTWKSDNPDVVSVDSNGNVTAHSLGNTTITVKTEEGEFIDICYVSVVEISTYTVTYPDNGTGEYEENERITFKTDLTKQGYKLVGYKYNNKDYKLTDELLMPSQDITLEAIWELVIPDATNNNKYVVEDNYFKNINLNTNITNLDLGLDNIYTIKITKDNEVKTSGLVGTGDIINIYLGDDLVTSYTVIIKGDITGSGDVKVADVAKLYQYLKKKITMDECYVKAGNVVDSDNEIKVSDVAKLYQYLKKKINKL